MPAGQHLRVASRPMVFDLARQFDDVAYAGYRQHRLFVVARDLRVECGAARSITACSALG